ncbi:MAG: MBL fold metallo-hydrolase [Paludibacteraceae bacterium]|nr:MBL fold metallo-hydrolase [Paludibacteraceae bacterium]
MTITVLIDNKKQTKALTKEWGLSLYIDFEGHKYLLDAGQSGAFADNAQRLHIDLTQVDAAVLSHAHYDHANGLERFFACNPHAPLYVREGTAEDCYHQIWCFRKYIGIRRGLLARYDARIRYIKGCYEINHHVWLIPHDNTTSPYSSPHEQSLVFDTEQGLVICSSCSHAGIDTILEQVYDALPNRQLYAFVGGLHLFRTSGKEVRYLANRLSNRALCMVNRQPSTFYVGHCTGNRAFAVLHEVLGDRVQPLYTGLTLTL